MEDQYDSHPVKWTAAKISRFWDFIAANRQGEFFSQKHSNALATTVLRNGRPERFVDVGCGNGALVLELAKRGVRAVGFDTSVGALDEARKGAAAISPAPTFEYGQIDAVPMSDGDADFVAILEVIEHLDDETLATALTETQRILRPGGTLMITCPNRENLIASTVECPDCGGQFHSMQHVRSWTQASLGGLLRDAGFRDVVVRGTRFVENGPATERIARGLYYRFRRGRPRLLAFARRA